MCNLKTERRSKEPIAAQRQFVLFEGLIGPVESRALSDELTEIDSGV